MKAFRRVIGGVSALALLMLGTALVDTASAVVPACGSVISSNTTLTGDVGPCNSGNGLVVTGNNITLNLNGHRVFSDAPSPRNTGCNQLPVSGNFAVPVPCDPALAAPNRPVVFTPADVVGIKILNSTNVTVTNGTVEDFAAGVTIERGGSNTVRGITARNNIAPCIGENFTTQAVGTYGDGIAVFSSTNNKITNNVAQNNGPFSGISVVADVVIVNQPVQPLPTGNLVANNAVRDNNGCFGEIGIRIEGPGASNNTVSGNQVSRSFLEGISVLAVNNINFAPLFANPPTCQNRGFPDPNLPLCPILPNQPANSNNVIRSNHADHNGRGGAEVPFGPGAQGQPAPSPQVRGGINLLSFCGYGTLNGSGNTIQSNTSTYNAGHGIQVGGCSRFDTNPVGWINNKILTNVSLYNNAAGCGVLPSPAGCGTRPYQPRFDLFDSTGIVTCPSTTAAIQAFCATQGFAAPPGGSTPFQGTFVFAGGAAPNNQLCDNNTWFGNTYGTAFPACTTVGGRQVPTGGLPNPGSSAQAKPGTAAQGGSGGGGSGGSAPAMTRGGRVIG